MSENTEQTTQPEMNQPPVNEQEIKTEVKEEVKKEEVKKEEVRQEEPKPAEKPKEKPQKFSLAWEKQKPVKDLTLEDIIMWRNIYVSLVLFLSGHAFYSLITKYHFSFLTLIGRILQFQVIIFFVYSVVIRIWKNTASVELPFSNFQLTEDMIKPFVDTWVKRFNNAIAFYVDVLLCKNIVTTLKVLAALQVACVIGNWIRGRTLLYLTFLFGFTIPKVYEVYQEPIDKYVDIGITKAKEYAKKAYEKIPTQYQEKIEKYIKFKTE
jgi:hypothetical protein